MEATRRATAPDLGADPTGSAEAVGARRGRVVVVGLDRGDDSVLPILRHALQEADRRGAHLRVVRILPPGAGRDDVVAADSSMGRLASLLPAPGSGPLRFEVVVGEPVEVLVERSVDALLLVVGCDEDAAPTPVARSCRALTRCPVMTVPHP